MADDIVFELLHSEIINYALDQSKDNNNDKKVVRNSFNPIFVLF